MFKANIKTIQENTSVETLAKLDLAGFKTLFHVLQLEMSKVDYSDNDMFILLDCLTNAQEYFISHLHKLGVWILTNDENDSYPMCASQDAGYTLLAFTETPQESPRCKSWDALRP